jgi:hypothetical protein
VKLDGLRSSREHSHPLTVSDKEERTKYAALVAGLEMLKNELFMAETMLEIARGWIGRSKED